MGGACSILPWQTPHVFRKSIAPIDSELPCVEEGGPAGPVPLCAMAYPATANTASFNADLLIALTFIVFPFLACGKSLRLLVRRSKGYQQVSCLATLESDVTRGDIHHPIYDGRASRTD